MSPAENRVEVDGKFLRLGDAPFRVRGVTYGSFVARFDGWHFPDRHQLKKDLAAIAEAGLNTVRTYELPPPELVETAEELELRVIVGLDYEDWRMQVHQGRRACRNVLDAGRRAVATAMEALDASPSVLAVAIGNEVPVDLVRINGFGAVENVLSRLIADVHAADPQMLATYVNFPTTEFLEPRGQNLTAFNVFLEEPDALRRYVGHLQVLSADKPLLITELGLPAEVHGEYAQMESLAWQLRALDEAGCAGGTVFSWTDEWAVNDEEVGGWGFGITTCDRTPKPAMGVVTRWADHPHPRHLRRSWPRISVVVCAYNEERAIEQCLSSLLLTDYPDLEVIVCDDGSTDSTYEIARRFPFKTLALPHQGLSTTRNAGIATATGEIVAFLDADAACHPEWPYHLALSLEDPDLAATGGPNLPFREAGFVERAIALAPGAAAEVLVADDRAEHVPGCNMAFRKEELEALGGFDTRFVSAGDDVDVCWKVLDRGHAIGFSPAAQVHHHRRATLRGYLRQQRGYGRAERMLSRTHSHRFNRLGHARWLGVVYGGSRILPSLLRPVVYTGYMGMAPFQPITRRRAEIVSAWATALLPLTVPLAGLGSALALLSAWWLVLPALLFGLTAAYGAAVAKATRVDHQEPHPIRFKALVGALHILQPMARAWGRLMGPKVEPEPVPEVEREWTGDRTVWLRDLKRALEATGCMVRIAPPGAAYDLRAYRGPFASAHITTAVLWNWQPQYRVRSRPRWLAFVIVTAGMVLGLSGYAWGWLLVAGALAWVAVAVATLRGCVRRTCIHSIKGSRT